MLSGRAAASVFLAVDYRGRTMTIPSDALMTAASLRRGKRAVFDTSVRCRTLRRPGEFVDAMTQTVKSLY
jgi:hypothetical protein